MTAPSEYVMLKVVVRDDEWEPTGDSDLHGRLSLRNCHLMVAGIPMHVEAHAVKSVAGTQESDSEWPDDYESICAIASPDGPLYHRTITCQGVTRDYIIYCYPYTE